jgi:hypothetical protein
VAGNVCTAVETATKTTALATEDAKEKCWQIGHCSAVVTGERFLRGRSIRVVPSLDPSLIPGSIAPIHTFVLPADTAWPQPGKK